YKIHAVPRGRGRVGFAASITLWPALKGTRGRARGAHGAAGETRWYRETRRQVRRYGYRGQWETSSTGRWGNFWKKLVDVNAAAAEARFLERVAHRRQLWGASNDEVQLRPLSPQWASPSSPRRPTSRIPTRR